MTRQLKKEEVTAFVMLQLNDHANYIWVRAEGNSAQAKKMARNTTREDLIELIDGMIDFMAAGN